MELAEVAVAVLTIVLILLHPLCLSNKTSIVKKQDGTSTHSSTSSSSNCNCYSTALRCSVVGCVDSCRVDSDCLRDRHSSFPSWW